MLDFARPVETKDGRPVRVLCTDHCSIGGLPNTIVGLVKMEGKREEVARWSSDGVLLGCHRPGDWDGWNLVQVKEKWWVNVYKENGKITLGWLIHSSREEADKHRESSWVTCVQIEF